LSTETITRKFALELLSANGEISNSDFDKFAQSVNRMISSGINLSEDIFKNDGLPSVKRFYSTISNNHQVKSYLQSLEFRERVHRCASQYAFYAIRNAKQIEGLIQIIAESLSSKSSWVDSPRQTWNHWIITNEKKKAHQKTLNQKYIAEIVERHNEINSSSSSWISTTIIQNYYIHLKKIIQKNLLGRVSLSQISYKLFEKILFENYSKEYIEYLMKYFCRRVSSVLTRGFKRLRKQHISKIHKKSRNTKLSKLVYGICGTRKIETIDTKQWQLKKELWLLHYRSNLDKGFGLKTVSKVIKIAINSLSKVEDSYFINEFLFPSKAKVNHSINSDATEDFVDFFSQIAMHHLTRLIIEKNRDVFLPEIRKVLLEIKNNTMNFLKQPTFKKSSIPLGIDDNQVYSIAESNNEVEIKISLYPNEWQIFRLKKPKRYFELRKRNYSSHRGFFSVKGGKFQLAIPFKKRLPDLTEEKSLEKQKMLNIDLGLKTLATLSIIRNEVELERIFLDQKQIIGPKDKWFLPVDKKNQLETCDFSKLINFKWRLIKLQRKAFDFQSKMNRIRYENKQKRKTNHKLPHYNKTKAYWYARRHYKNTWLKIQRIHTELINQVSARIVEYAIFHQIDSIRFEDLRWSQHSRRDSIGYFLSDWQIHWFFSRIIEATSIIARRNNIRTYIVDPKNSSKACSKCGKIGRRVGKNFNCVTEWCKLRIDSDLNSARNLGSLSRKTHLIRL